MKRIITLLQLIVLLEAISFSQTKYPVIVMETSKGTIKIMLYDSTIHHSENFVKLVNEGYYNGQLFHRVIKNFMIQSGDAKSINPQPGDTLGTGGKSYRIPAEFFPEYYHKKGVIAAARESDIVNPNKESSGSQFYIVQGKVFTKEQLDMMVKMKKHPTFSEEQIKTYTTLGGTPHLDYNYTVFGEILEGLDIVEAISLAPTDKMDRPLEDVRIIKMYTIQ
jgi:cyclophilin family peptidyl-prolyl cis-trans isomerase